MIKIQLCFLFFGVFNCAPLCAMAPSGWHSAQNPTYLSPEDRKLYREEDVKKYLQIEPTFFMDTESQKLGNRLFETLYALAEQESPFPPAQFLLGVILLYGWHTNKNVDRAISLLQRASERGHAQASLLLSQYYAGKAAMPQQLPVGDGVIYRQLSAGVYLKNILDMVPPVVRSLYVPKAKHVKAPEDLIQKLKRSEEKADDRKTPQKAQIEEPEPAAQEPAKVAGETQPPKAILKRPAVGQDKKQLAKLFEKAPQGKKSRPDDQCTVEQSLVDICNTIKKMRSKQVQNMCRPFKELLAQHKEQSNNLLAYIMKSGTYTAVAAHSAKSKELAFLCGQYWLFVAGLEQAKIRSILTLHNGAVGMDPRKQCQEKMASFFQAAVEGDDAYIPAWLSLGQMLLDGVSIATFQKQPLTCFNKAYTLTSDEEVRKAAREKIESLAAGGNIPAMIKVMHLILGQEPVDSAQLQPYLERIQKLSAKNKKIILNGVKNTIQQVIEKQHGSELAFILSKFLFEIGDKKNTLGNLEKVSTTNRYAFWYLLKVHAEQKRIENVFRLIDGAPDEFKDVTDAAKQEVIKLLKGEAGKASAELLYNLYERFKTGKIIGVNQQFAEHCYQQALAKHYPKALWDAVHAGDPQHISWDVVEHLLRLLEHDAMALSYLRENVHTVHCSMNQWYQLAETMLKHDVKLALFCFARAESMQHKECGLSVPQAGAGLRSKVYQHLQAQAEKQPVVWYELASLYLAALKTDKDLEGQEFLDVFEQAFNFLLKADAQNVIPEGGWQVNTIRFRLACRYWQEDRLLKAFELIENNHETDELAALYIYLSFCGCIEGYKDDLKGLVEKYVHYDKTKLSPLGRFFLGLSAKLMVCALLSENLQGNSEELIGWVLCAEAMGQDVSAFKSLLAEDEKVAHVSLCEYVTNLLFASCKKREDVVADVDNTEEDFLKENRGELLEVQKQAERGFMLARQGKKDEAMRSFKTYFDHILALPKLDRQLQIIYCVCEIYSKYAEEDPLYGYVLARYRFAFAKKFSNVLFFQSALEDLEKAEKKCYQKNPAELLESGALQAAHDVIITLRDSAVVARLAYFCILRASVDNDMIPSLRAQYIQNAETLAQKAREFDPEKKEAVSYLVEVYAGLAIYYHRNMMYQKELAMINAALALDKNSVMLSQSRARLMHMLRQIDKQPKKRR